MAYNREWDNGKDHYNGDVHWQSGGSVRRREDDSYSGETKRRKYNSSENYQGHDNAYEDYDSYGKQGGGGSSKKRLVASEPSPHVIFLGLDPDFTESDLQAYLSSNGCSIETVTIIRERATGASKGFGFAQFTSTEHARTFVDPLFPFIQVPPPASHGAGATTAFYRALSAGQPANGRRVKIDFSQSATPNEKGRFQKGNVNDGTRDIGNQQAPILLFRGLDPLSGPQAVHQAVRNSAGLGKDGAKGMKRIILIKDRVTMASFGFAFVEFVDINSAATVLGSTMNAQVHPAGFRVSDIPIAASFGHSESFRFIDNPMLRDETCIASSAALGGAEGSWVKYWDESATVAVLEFQVAAPTPQVQTKTHKEKKKATHVAKPAAPAAPSAITLTSKPMIFNLKGGAKLSASAAAKTTQAPAALGFMDDPEEDEAEDPAIESSAPIFSKKTASNISKWNQKQGELTHGASHPAVASAVQAPPIPQPRPQPVEAPIVAKPAPISKEATPEDDLEYADAAGKSCYLCSRQFKTTEQLKRHNKESDLHKTNLGNEALRATALQKAAKGKQPKYRDRASERRVLFNQPDVPLPEGVPAKRKSEEPTASASQPPPPPVHINPGEDSSNVGNKLLKMMGWTEGSGLGTSGEGRVEPIKTEIFAAGVGLGASKGREVGKYGEGYSGYVSMAQDAARERYGS